MTASVFPFVRPSACAGEDPDNPGWPHPARGFLERHEPDQGRAVMSRALWTGALAAPVLKAEPAEPAPALSFDSADWSEHDIPLRPWVVQDYILRGAVTVLTGPPSAGKSTIMIGWATALALGRSFGKFMPTGPMRSIVFNIEDDQDEQKRRFSAMVRQFGAKTANLSGQIVRSTAIQSGKLVQFNARTGAYSLTPAFAELKAETKRTGADVVFIDPLVEIHDVPESDNGSMQKVMQELRTFAREAAIGLVVVSHPAKSSNVPGDPSAVRGAGSIVGSARIVATAFEMDDFDAKAFNIPPVDQWRYVRLDGAKANYSRRTETDWFERVEWTLASGEIVAALKPWTPPADIAATVTDEQVGSIITGIGEGCSIGEPWSPKLSKDQRSVKHLFKRNGVDGNLAQTALLDRLQSTDGILVASFRRPNRVVASGLRTAAGMPKANWIDAR